MALFGSKAYNRNELFRRGDQFRSRGRNKKAIKEFEKILAVDPKDIDVHAKLAPLYQKVGRTAEAKTSLNLVTDEYHRKGFEEKEIAVLKIILKVDTHDLKTYFQLVNLYIQKGLKSDALSTLGDGRRAFRKKKFLQEAIAIERRILTIEPEDFSALVLLVKHLWKSGENKEASERLLSMESQWASRRNRKNWRKTRWLLFRHSHSLSAFLGYLSTFLSTPSPYKPQERKRFLH